MSNDNAEFSAYCVLRSELGGENPYSESTMETMLAKLGVPYKAPKSEGGKGRSVTRGKLNVGEVVIVRSEKCKHELNQQNCKRLNFSYDNPRYFVVESIVFPSNPDDHPIIKIKELDETGRSTGSVYDFYAVPPSRGTSGLVKTIKQQEKYELEGSKRFSEQKLAEAKQKLDDKALEPHEGHGLYRAGFGDQKYFQRYLAEFNSREKFEVVYQRGLDTVTPSFRTSFTENVRAEALTTMIESGEVEAMDLLDEASIRKYVSFHFIAPIPFFSKNEQTSQSYALVDTKVQRGSSTFINPSIGKIYYIGKVGQRPNGWREALQEMLADNADSI
jgi:hypothetical protein